jgi:hypothetical protein
MSKTHLRLTVLIVLLAIAAIVALRWSQVSRSSSPTIDRDALLHLVNARTDAYNLSNTQAQAAFASVVSQDVEAAFNAILAKVPEATAQLTSWETSAELTYRLAADKLNGTETAAELVASIIVPTIGTPSVQATALACQHLNRFCLQLAENSTLYGADLATMLSGPEVAPVLPEAALQDLGTALADIAAQVNEAAFDTALATIGAGLEVIFIKSGLVAVTRVIAAAVTRMGAGSAVGAGCAAADGPMPVGDVIGAMVFAGSAAWTTWDLYRARVRLPREIALDLTNKISACRDNVIKTTLDSGNQALELHNQAAANVVAQLHQHLQGE